MMRSGAGTLFPFTDTSVSAFRQCRRGIGSRSVLVSPRQPRMRPLIAVVVPLVLLWIGPSLAQQCEPFEGSPEVCLDFYNTTTLIYSPGVPQAILSAYIAPKANALPFIKNLSCRNGLAKILCGVIFPLCYQNFTAPQKICQSLCKKVETDCIGSIEPDSLNCSSIDPDGTPTYPAGPTLDPNDGTLVPCLTNLTSTSHITEPNCFRPFVRTDTYGCEIECPAPVFTKRAYHQIQNWAAYGLGVSTICFLVSAGVLALVPARMQYPLVVSLWFLIGSANTLLMASVGYGFTAPACVNRWTPESQKRGDVWCTIVGSWFVWSAHSSTTWLLLLLGTVYCSLYQPQWFLRRTWGLKLRLAIHSFSWGWGFIPMIIALGFQKMVSGGLGCSIDTASHHGVWADALHWGPYAVQTAIGVMLIFLIWVKLFRSVGFRVMFRKHRRLILFLSYHLWVNTFAVYQRVDSRIRQDGVVEDLKNWAQCSVNATAMGLSQLPSDCKQGRTFSTAVGVVGFVNMTVVGPLALIVFAFTPENCYAIDARFSLNLFRNNPLLSTSRQSLSSTNHSQTSVNGAELTDSIDVPSSIEI